MSDIVERLERFAKEGAGVSVLIDAADEIKRLRTEKLELANHIDGCVRVAADALKRAESAEALLAIANISNRPKH